MVGVWPVVQVCLLNWHDLNIMRLCLVGVWPVVQVCLLNWHDLNIMRLCMTGVRPVVQAAVRGKTFTLGFSEFSAAVKATSLKLHGVRFPWALPVRTSFFYLDFFVFKVLSDFA